MGAHRQYYRVVSGSMRVLIWANGYRQAIRQARSLRNWRELSPLTKFQIHCRPKKGKPFWKEWEYVITEDKP